MATVFIEKWLAGKLLNCVWDKAVEAASQPKLMQAFEKACIKAIEEYRDIFSEESFKALSYTEGMPGEVDLSVRLQKSFKNQNFPSVDELQKMLAESWENRRKQLKPEEAADFLILSKEKVMPVIRTIASAFFDELAQIPKYRDAILVKAAQHGLTEKPEKAPKDIWHVPHGRNEYFTGREDVLLQMRQTLVSGGSVAVSQATQVLSGLGGIGKTQTAVEYAYRYSEEYKEVFWLGAESKDLLVSGFMETAGLLGLTDAQGSSPEQAIPAVLNWFNSNKGWLLIFDNADDPDVLHGFMPTAQGGHVIVTSRAHEFDSLGIRNPVSLDKMREVEAERFLLKRTAREEQELVKDEEDAVKEIIENLDFLPLAIEQAGAYIKKTGCKFRQYLAEYEKHGLEWLEKIQPVTGRYPESVLTTWGMNFKMVEQASKASADILRACAFLHSEEIPLEIFTLGADELGEDVKDALVNDNSLVINELLALIEQYSLIKRDAGADTFDIHRLVQSVIRYAMDKDLEKQWAERVVMAVNMAFPYSEFKTWPQCERLLQHAKTCAEHIEKFHFESKKAGRLLNQAGYYLDDRGRYYEAEPLYKRSLEISEKALGHQHLHVAIALNNLAELYRSQGKNLEAEPLYKRALEISEKALGPEHPSVATSLNNLALLYHDQGKYQEAEPLIKRALEIRGKILGPEHPEVAQSLNNLASLYSDQGKYQEAEPLYMQSLEITEKALGPEHPDVAFSLNNLAGHYYVQGKYSEAEPLFKRSLETREKALGPEHPGLAQSLNNMAELYRAQGKYSEAEPLFRRSLEIWEKVLGPEHPDVAVSLNNLALLYSDQGKYHEAEPLYKQSLEIREKALGAEHPDVANSLENYAALLRETGREAEADELESRATAMRKKHGW